MLKIDIPTECNLTDIYLIVLETILNSEMAFLQGNYPSSRFVNSKTVCLLWEFYLSSSHFLLQAKFYFPGSPYQSSKRDPVPLIAQTW